MHRDKDQWHDPLAFTPDRWSQYQEPRDSPAGGMSPTNGTSSAAGIRNTDRIASSNSSRSSSNGIASSSNGNVSSSTQGFADQTSSPGAAHSNVQHAYVHGRQSDTSSSTGLGSGHRQGMAKVSRDPEQGRAVGSSGPELAKLSGKSGQRQKAKAGAASILSGMGPNGTYVPFGAGPRNCIGTGQFWHLWWTALTCLCEQLYGSMLVACLCVFQCVSLALGCIDVLSCMGITYLVMHLFGLLQALQ